MSALPFALLDLLFPRACLVCGGAVADETGGHVCWDCAAAFPRVELPFCTRCGDPVDGRVESAYTCSFCRRRRPRFDRARSALRYRGGVRRAVHALKYGHATYASRDLARWMAACCRVHYADERFDTVTAVPLHARRQRERTYNQAELLGRALAAELRLDFAGRLLRRTRATASQTELSAAERRRNVNKAFTAADGGWIDGRRILLVDDVMTTGATVAECSRVLKDAGAVTVHVITAARG